MPGPRLPSPVETSPILHRALAKFESLHQVPATAAAMAPGRINWMGDHVDYCGGLVLPMALDRVTVVVGARIGENSLRIYSTSRDEAATFPLDSLSFRPTPPHWTAYPRGVVAGVAARGWRVPGFAAVIDSSVPPGAGLSSSAALEVAMATFLEALLGSSLGAWEKALLCQKAEHDYAGVPCGLMDQVASVFGRDDHLVLFDCESLKLEHVPFPAGKMTAIAIDTGVRHELGKSEYPARRADCERAARQLGAASLRHVDVTMLERNRGRMDPVAFRRARHVVGEIERTRSFAKAIAAGAWDHCATLMKASHDSLRNDFEVSCPELDAVVDTAEALGREQGIFGCRMTGGGFGGCCVALIETAAMTSAIPALEKGYRRRTERDVQILVTRPGAGATALEVTDLCRPTL